MSDDLEQELRALTPIAPSPQLDTTIEHALTVCHAQWGRGPAGHVSDRLLAATLSLAAAAAVLIITLLTTDYLNAPAPTPAQIATDQPHPTTLADTQRLLAELTDDRNAGILPASQATQPRF